ncbi:uncharacterized protein [Amphiura filiformis]|uniref:uncharacterized protein n=1 Tax=Amphiura filiformis TaxID=82378 RepID=UPI003B219765
MTSLLFMFVFVTYSTTGVHGNNGALGTQFIFAIPYSPNGGIPSVFISTHVKDPVTVSVSVPEIGFRSLANVARDRGTRIDLPEEAALTLSHIITNKTVVIQAGEPVSIHGYYKVPGRPNLAHYSADGFLVLPTTALGKNYVAVGFSTFENNYHGYSVFAVSAIEDSTTVSLVFKRQTKFTISLKQYESYQFVADITHTSTDINDVTGMLINADKTISVMSGHQGAVVPNQPSPTDDYMMENIPPVSTLGQHYILAPFLGRTSGFVYRVVATSSGTTHVTMSGVNVSLLTGEFYEGNTMTSEDLITVLSDKPIIVCQYAMWHWADFLGDTFMVLLPSTQAFSYNVTFPVAALTLSENPRYFISITSECGNINSFYLDGMPLINNERILQTSDGAFCVLRTSITTGFHSVTHPSASFLVMVYGFAILYGYGYVDGYNIGPNMEASGDTSTASNVMPSGCLPIMSIYSDEGTIAPAKNLYEYGDVITVFCRKGLHHIGDDQLVCLNTGSWLGEIPRCSTDNEEGKHDNVK